MAGCCAGGDEYSVSINAGSILTRPVSFSGKTLVHGVGLVHATVCISEPVFVK